MVEATATTYFIWFFAVFQWAIAGWILSVPRPGPARVTHAALLLLNGATTFGAGLRYADPYREIGGLTEGFFALYNGADAPTAAWLMLLVWLFRRGTGLNIPWSRGTRIAVPLLIAYSIGQVAFTAFSPDVYQAWQVDDITAGLPIIIAYGAVTTVLARALVRATTPRDRRIYAFLFLAFGLRAIEFAYVYGVAQPVHDGQPLIGFIAYVLYLILAALLLVIFSWMTWHAVQRPAGARRELTAVLAGSLAIVVYAVGYYRTDLGMPFLVFNLVTLVVARPLFIALAYDVGAAFRITGSLGMLMGLFFLVKAFGATVLDEPFWQVGRTDLLAVGACILAVIPFFLRPSSPNSDSDMGDSARLTHAHRLAMYLLERADKADDSGVTGADIERAVGITANNVAGELRRLERLLGDGMGTGAVEARLLGVRGRKYFRLTSSGQAAVRDALQRLGLDGKPRS